MRVHSHRAWMVAHVKQLEQVHRHHTSARVEVDFLELIVKLLIHVLTIHAWTAALVNPTMQTDIFVHVRQATLGPLVKHLTAVLTTLVWMEALASQVAPVLYASALLHTLEHTVKYFQTLAQIIHAWMVQPVNRPHQVVSCAYVHLVTLELIAKFLVMSVPVIHALTVANAKYQQQTAIFVTAHQDILV